MARHKTAAGDGTSAGEVPATVAAVALPEVAVDQSKSNFIAAVTTSAIDAKNKLVGFQGDFTFDERVVTFQSEPVQKAGLTGGNWNVSGNVLPGTGPIRTLRISAYSNDFTPLSGSGTLFELRMTRVSKAAQGTPLLWAAPPDQFIFIDADLNTQKPGNAAPGSVTPSGVAAHGGDFTVPPLVGGETATVTRLAGYWQVSGKNKTTFQQMIEMDLFYAKNLSLGLDLWIMVKTPGALVMQTLDLLQQRTAALANRSAAPQTVPADSPKKASAVS